MHKKGFTLIELLVVVLIIGILAAIAVPQYSKVIARSRLSEALQNTGTILQAQLRYHTANGVYSTDLAELDLTFDMKPVTVPGYSSPWKFYRIGDMVYTLEMNNTLGGVGANYYKNGSLQGGIERFPADSTHSLKGKTTCQGWTALYQQVCQSLGGKDTGLITADSKAKVYEISN